MIWMRTVASWGVVHAIFQTCCSIPNEPCHATCAWRAWLACLYVRKGGHGSAGMGWNEWIMHYCGFLLFFVIILGNHVEAPSEIIKHISNLYYYTMTDNYIIYYVILDTVHTYLGLNHLYCKPVAPGRSRAVACFHPEVRVLGRSGMYQDE